MPDRIEVIYENGVFRPVAALPRQYQEHQRLIVTIDGPNGVAPWLADADPTVSLDAVRQALGKVPGTLAQHVRAERDER